jgi:hypothetical protein
VHITYTNSADYFPLPKVIYNVVIVYLLACNYAKGKWIADEKWPLYSGYKCKQWLPKKYNCGVMGRTDLSFESYRWQPHGCEMPEFLGTNFLNRYYTLLVLFYITLKG